MTIWKYILKPTCEIEMPTGAQILSVHAQPNKAPPFKLDGEEICIWAKVEPANPKETRKFVVFGTGHPVPCELHMQFLGTALLHGGLFTYHVFEVLP